MTKPLKHIFSLTYPITSLFTGYSFNEGIKFCFPEPTTIEDLWLPYYCVSTDISTSTERVHKVESCYNLAFTTHDSSLSPVWGVVEVREGQHELRLAAAAHL